MAVCYYCGQTACDREHVIERSILNSLQSVSIGLRQEIAGQRKLMVPSCRECNALLVGTVQFSLKERKTFVKMRLRQKYSKLLSMPNWTDEELNGIGPHIRSHIVNSLKCKEIVQRRILW